VRNDRIVDFRLRLMRTLAAFLLNHSWAYGVAAVASWAEYAIEARFFPGLQIPLISRLGEMHTCRVYIHPLVRLPVPLRFVSHPEGWTLMN